MVNVVKCPVCERKLESMLCTGCGFDGSLDYARYPVFGKTVFKPVTVSSLRAGLKGRFRCECGSFRFWVDETLTEFTCADCGKQHAARGGRAAPRKLGKPLPIPPEGCLTVSVGGNLWGQRNLRGFPPLKAVAVNRYATVGLRTDGRVELASTYNHGRYHTEDWRQIKAVSAGNAHVVGLREDGTVVATGDFDRKQCNVSEWKEITAIAAGSFATVGLRRDGTVCSTIEGLTAWKMTGWKDITAIAAGREHVVGLHRNGTVEVAGTQMDTKAWSDIVAVAAGDDHTVGLQSDGTVVAVGNNDYGQCNVGKWTGVVAIAAGGHKTVGVRSDGTVVCTSPGMNVSDWDRIAAVAISDVHLVGLKVPVKE